MKPSVIIDGKRAIYPNPNKLTIQFLFPFPRQGGGEFGEIDLINGDVPQIIITAPASIQVERVLKRGKKG